MHNTLEEIIKMKKMFLIATLLGAVVLSGADFAAQVKEADAVLAQSTDSKARYQAIQKKFTAMRKLKQYNESEKFLIDAVKTDKHMRASHKRGLLNYLAGLNLWNGRHMFALEVLKQAGAIEVSHASNDYYRTFFYQACIYNGRTKEYQKTLDSVTPLLTDPKIHPVCLYDCYSVVGSAYEKLGDKAKALDAFKKAIEVGKKGKRKVTDAEKAVVRLSK